jgi:hypothetical protein
MMDAVSSEVCADLPKEDESQTPAPPNQSTSRQGMAAPYVVLGIVLTLYLVFSIHVLRAGLSSTGTLVFPLDDTYIGMAMAKNLALHGVWGISATRFASAASSPGYILLLAGLYRVTGPTVWGPLAFSLTFGLLALVMAWRLLARTHWGVQLLALLAILYFTPMHVVGLLGMEHSLHLLLVLGFLQLVGNALGHQKSSGWGLMILTGAMVSVRYESLFMVGVAGLLYLLQRQVWPAIRLGLAAATPVVLYGAISMWNGAYWLPHSIAMKGLSGRAAMQTPIALANHFERDLARAPYLGVLLCMIVVLLTMPRVLADKRLRAMLDIVFGGIILHLALADVGRASVYRYEAYVIGAAIAVIACAMPCVTISRDKWQAAALSLLALAGIVLMTQRTVEAAASLPERSKAIYSQQVQMALFMQQYEEGAVVAANDVGAINFYADIDCLDLFGLGDSDVFWLKRKGLYTNAALTKLAADRNVKIAVVYDYWFSVLTPIAGPPLPLSWIRVGRWQTPDGFYLGGDTVSFYAASPAESVKLKSALDAFAPSLPRDVEALGP